MNPVLGPAVDVVLCSSTQRCYLIVTLCGKRVHIFQVVHGDRDVAGAVILAHPVGCQNPDSDVSEIDAHERTRVKTGPTHHNNAHISSPVDGHVRGRLARVRASGSAVCCASLG